MNHGVLVDVLRGGHVESFHRGSFVIVDEKGHIIRQSGDVKKPIFPRSALKPIQTISLIESGAADQWQVTPQEVALGCSSHYGEDIHVAAVEKWLHRLHLDESDLKCGLHRPMSGSVARSLERKGQRYSQLHNACSGKHTAFLTQAVFYGNGIEDYYARTHTVQQRVEQIMTEMMSYDFKHTPHGIDGCSIPALMVPLYNVALGMARMTSAQDVPPQRQKACKRIVEALQTYPQMLAGSGVFDTLVIETTKGGVLPKMGASGVQVAILPQHKVGIALKVDDGSNAAAELVMLALLHQGNYITTDEYEALTPVRPILTYRGLKVGEMRVAKDFG